MNVCSKTHTHAVESGARQNPGKLGNLSQTHTPELPGTEAGRRERQGRRGELFPADLSLHPDFMCSFWIGNTCTGGQDRNQKSAAYKKDCLAQTLSLQISSSSPSLGYWQWGLPRRDWLFCPINNNTSSECMHCLCLYF